VCKNKSPDRKWMMALAAVARAICTYESLGRNLSFPEIESVVREIGTNYGATGDLLAIFVRDVSKLLWDVQSVDFETAQLQPPIVDKDEKEKTSSEPSVAHKQKASEALPDTETAPPKRDSVGLKELFNILSKAPRRALFSYIWAINNGCSSDDRQEDIHKLICDSFDDPEITLVDKEPCPVYEMHVPSFGTWSRSLRRAVKTAKKEFGTAIFNTLAELGLLRRSHMPGPQGHSAIPWRDM